MPDKGNANFVTLYASKAHVFQIDPTKEKWIAKSEEAIQIAIVASIGSNDPETSANDGAKRELKVIGRFKNGEIALDATIAKDPQFTFIKRSHKFGQWHDQSHVLYGLGFSEESALDTFLAKFQNYQREILSSPAADHQQPTQPPSSSALPSGNIQSHLASSLQQQQQQQQPHASKMQGWNPQETNNNNISETNGRFQPNKQPPNSVIHYSNTLGHPTRQQAKRGEQQLAQGTNGNNSFNNGISSEDQNNHNNYPRSQSMFGLQSKTVVSPENGATLPSQHDWQQAKEQLKYENERLKQILEENARISAEWKSELVNLRINNEKLTKALQESRAHVQQWEDELLGLREENKELKLKIKALELASDPEQENPYKRDLQNYLAEVQKELRQKEDEISEMRKSMEALELRAQSVSNNNEQNTDNLQITPQQKQKLDIINAKLEAKVMEFSNLQKEFGQLVDKFHE